jgi:hypothetical protein
VKGKYRAKGARCSLKGERAYVPFSQFEFATPSTSSWQHSGVLRGPQTPVSRRRGTEAAAVKAADSTSARVVK